MLTLEHPAAPVAAVIDAPAATTTPPARLQDRDRRLLDAIVRDALAPPVPASGTPEIVPMIPWIVPALAVLISASILLIWAAVL